jgi:hypothetical protein
MLSPPGVHPAAVTGLFLATRLYTLAWLMIGGGDHGRNSDTRDRV